MAGVGDFNGDGKADILWRNADGTITDWLGQANGGFADNSALALQPLDLSLTIAGVGDFNGDGKADMLLEWSDGSLQTWTGYGSGAILSPMEKQWQDVFVGTQALMAQMAAAEINASVQSLHTSTPQIDDISSEMGTAVADMWYMQNPSMWPNAPSPPDPIAAERVAQILHDLNSTGNSNLHLNLVDGGGFSATFDGILASLTPIDQANGVFDYNFNGLDLIAHWTGNFSSNPPPDPQAIVVTGTKAAPPPAPAAPNPVLYLPSGFSISPSDNGYHQFDGFGGMGNLSSPFNTAISHSTRIVVGHHSIYLPANMTPEQKAAADAFIAGIRSIDLWIGSMPSNATLHVVEKWTDSSGQSHTQPVTETVSDLQAHWQTTSFGLFADNVYSTLNGVGTNGTGRGSSDMGLDPQMVANVVAGFNLDLVSGYFQSNGQVAMEYLALHEVAHDTVSGLVMNFATPDRADIFIPGTSNYANENFANTVALATLEALGVNLGPYYAPSGGSTVSAGWQPADIWTVNSE